MASHKNRSESGRSDSPQKPPEGRPFEERLGRFLTFVLRHHPEKLDLTLDEKGSADFEALATAIRALPGFSRVTRQQIERMVISGPAASRFEILGDRIRARYGHTLPTPIEHQPADPPKSLFYGATPAAAITVLTEGLKAAERQQVHLSTDEAAAREFGLRRCADPVILRINTVGARKTGVKFYPAGPAVWLSDAIPPEFISRA